MGRVLGPILRLRQYDHTQDLWRLCALACFLENDPAPTLPASIDDGAPFVRQGTELPAIAGLRAFRFDLDVGLTERKQKIKYRLSSDPDEEWEIVVPAVSTQPTFAYGSCNGFSSLKLMKSVSDPNALWKHLMQRHADVEYNVLLLGGDQVYSDAMWELVPELAAWNELPWNHPRKDDVPVGLAEAL